jgi:predicted Zn-dependent protease
VTEFAATYYDGKTSARTAVRVWATQDKLRIIGAKLDVEIPLVSTRVDAPLAGIHRTIYLPEGAQLHTDDQAAVEELFPRTNLLENWVHRLERRWPYALAVLVLVAGFSVWCVKYGVPLAAEFATEFVSPELEANLGRQALSSIDATLCSPTRLDAEKQQSVRADFGMLTAGLDNSSRYQLELRACDRMGPNAFALPGGTIVLTDALVGLAQNDAQVSAVLAHEMGHVRYRHGVRMLLQAAGLGALISTLTADAVSITSLAVVLPTLLLQSGYSRDFEDEADSYAFQRLKAVGLSPSNLAEILERLEASRGKGTQAGKLDQGEGTFDYLSTHPATARRIERALANQ